MSDEEEYLSEESYEFEFEEEDEDEEFQDQPTEEESPENQYYYAKGLKDDSPMQAIEMFKQLIVSTNAKADSEWGFKASKQLAKIYYQEQQYDLVLKEIARLMTMLPQLNGNYAEESISKILTRYAACYSQKFVKDLYDVIVNHLRDFIQSGSSGHRIWLKININRLKNLLDIEDLGPCRELIDTINERLQQVSESTRNSYALEIIAAEIMFTMKTSGNPIRLDELYRRSLAVTPAITHPQVMGVVRECGATVQFYKGKYDTARLEFYECFKNYDEAGSSSKKKVLKYLIICCLLVESEVNPFESQETQSYAQLAEYGNLIDWVDTYEKLDLKGYEAIVAKMKESDSLADDPIFLISEKLILHNLKAKMLLNFAKAYRTVRFDFVKKKLLLTDDEHLEQLLVEMANSGSLPNFKINFPKRYVDFGTRSEKTILPPTLDERTVLKNVRSLYRLSYEGPWQSSAGDNSSDCDIEDAYYGSPQLNSFLDRERDSSTRTEGSSVCELLFGNPLLQIESTAEHEEWLKFMQSSIPKRKICASSQKDQVILEQREVSEENRENSLENEEAAASTNRGILGSAVIYGTDIVRKEEDEEMKDKLDLLREWAHKLSSDVHGQ